MESARAEVIVASTLYLISSLMLDASPCPCRVRAVVAHLEKMMAMDGVDPVLRATAIQLHASWQRVADGLAAADDAGSRTWH